ncbi:hypothetical protein O181_093934 [Austropuccinia psidii MF-1]|uniref:Uncharacterized protein n=1 Tax=Austropuccinia psidii MF-1 TaxID=1389203 RepID=A0A9Q3J268_9BASI|nr:hypothetical protein [Austropuccinia psidii MF-1]
MLHQTPAIDFTLHHAVPLLTLPHHHLIFTTAYHAHAPTVLSQYASNASTPCPPSTILMLPHHFHLPCPQDMPPTLPPHLCPTHPYTSEPPPLTIIMLPQHPQHMPPMLPPHVHRHHIFSAAYYAYPAALDQ